MVCAMKIPEPVMDILQLLTAAGHDACCVGGCVRDTLLGTPPGDWDIATSATPQETMTCLTAYPLLTHGIKHGTVTAISGGMPVEITTYRADGPYLDHRHPASVSFSKQLTADLARRDFTINAMAYRPGDGIIDLFQGQADLQNGCLRCVGDPNLRFQEDALRILRCLRFAARFSFSVAPETAAALFRQKGLLSHIAAERLQKEFFALLCSPGAVEILRNFSDVFFQFLPALARLPACAQETPYHIYDVWGHTLHAIDAAPADLTIRLALLFHDSGKPLVKTIDEKGIAHFYGHPAQSAPIAQTSLSALRTPKTLASDVCTLVTYHDSVLKPDRISVKRWLIRLGPQTFFRLLQVKRADARAQAPAHLTARLLSLDGIEDIAQALIQEGACLSLAQLAVTGEDLLSIGFSKGPLLGAALQELLDLVIAEQVPNEKARLLSIARRRLSPKTTNPN